jgi:uncharacterized membrane protein YraQ (UPF0718 family)
MADAGRRDEPSVECGLFVWLRDGWLWRWVLKMASIGNALASALSMAFAMGWEILWPLILGFALSGVVQAVVTKAEMSRLLPDSSPRSIVIASALGAAS